MFGEIAKRKAGLAGAVFASNKTTQQINRPLQLVNQVIAGPVQFGFREQSHIGLGLAGHCGNFGNLRVIRVLCGIAQGQKVCQIAALGWRDRLALNGIGFAEHFLCCVHMYLLSRHVGW
jgi:hypothetical protein